ncbi:MAG: hypothetical protein IJQ39_08285 [Thermoguttaceae bacterium]|nr:hypothetical protein [Thermoguttaceae bacterium]
MTTFQNDFRNVSLQNLVDNPDCSEDDVAQWVRDNEELFVDDSNPDEFSQDKVNRFFGDAIQNTSGGSFGNLGIDYSSVVDWFNTLGGQGKEDNPQQGASITDSVLTWGKKLLGFPDAQEEKQPAKKTSAGGFGMGKFDIGSLMKQTSNPQLKKVLWVLDTVYKEVKKLWSSKKRRTTRRKTTAKKTTSRSRTTAAKKTTTSRSTTAKKTVAKKTTAKKTPARTTTAKKTTAKKTTTRSTTAKKTTAKKPTIKKIW